MRVLAIEPFYGGSHKAFLDGLASRSAHDVTLLTLPGVKWKWRMRGGAVTLAAEAERMAGSFDVLFATDFLNLAEFRSLAPPAVGGLPAAVYFHENQLTYPYREQSERDYQFAFTNITTALAADEVWFNSAYHREDFLRAIGPFFAKLPRPRPADVAGRIEKKSHVLHLGVDLTRFDAEPQPEKSGPARIVWNQRWEFDKNPEGLFAALSELDETGAAFRLRVLGESYRDAPDVFETAKERFSDRIDLWGYQDSAADYIRALKGADVVVSTAIHEFFGASVVEAIYAGCYPLLPKRLAYPELLPARAHRHHLYSTPNQLVKRLCWCCENIGRVRAGPKPGEPPFPDWVRRFDWSERIAEFDAGLARIAERR